MTNRAPTDKQKVRARKLIDKWRGRLFLHSWHLDLFYMKEGEGEGGWDVLASINANPVYMKAKIQIFPAFWDRSPDVQEEALVHELCHCHTQALVDLVHRQQDGGQVTHQERIDTLERLTQQIAVIAMLPERKP